MSGILETINNTPITPEEMENYLRAMVEDEGEQGIERGVIIARQVFGDDKNKGLSINMRLTALTKIIKNEQLPGWVKPEQADGSYQVAANIYFAAGVEPLYEEGNDWGFDLDALLQRAFKMGTAD